MLSPEVVQISVALLAAFSVGGIVYVLVMPYLSGERKANRRFATVSQGQSARRARVGVPEQLTARKREVQDTIKELEAQQKSQKKASLRLQLRRAGLDVPERSFYIVSAITGLVIAGIVMLSGSSILVSAMAGFAGGVGLPRWLIKFMTKRRHAKFLRELANAIDIIVRGVKSGLPLNDCLQMIGREAPEPVKTEFADLVERQQVGIPLSKSLQRMYERVPLPEVNFFAIVVAIQQETGGNLAEALSNLSAVLRDRQRLAGKVAAFSAEAKASAMIIGALPLAVMLIVYITTPNYIAMLWTERLGQMMLIASAVWMLIGILVMRKMINFDY